MWEDTRTTTWPMGPQDYDLDKDAGDVVDDVDDGDVDDGDVDDGDVVDDVDDGDEFLDRGGSHS